VVRIVGSKLCTFIGERRDPEELLDRLVSAGLLAESVNLQRVLAAIEEAFEADARAFEPGAMLMAGEARAHMLLDHRVYGYLSPRGIALMKTDDP
jgi:hypothetical protein